MAALLQELIEVLLANAVAGSIPERNAAQRTRAAPAPHSVDGHLQLISNLGDRQELG